MSALTDMVDRARDIAAGILLLGGTVAYLSQWPHDFYPFDEGLYLYEARRVLDGEVMYRDFFDILPPAWFYWMALLYAVFGASMETARMGMAVVHALIGVLLYAVCRRAGVRPAVAVPAALTHLTICYPVNTQASPHWVSTLLVLVLAFVMLGRAGTTRGRAVLWGVLLGVLILVQQQKGAVMAAGGLLIVIADQWVEQPRRWLCVARRSAAFAGGVVGVVAPVMLTFVAMAGVENVLRALVWYPLINYRRVHDDTWLWGRWLVTLPPGRLSEYFPSLRLQKGQWPWVGELPDLGPLTYVIQYAPLTLPLAALAAIRRWWRGDGLPRRPLLVLLILSVFALLSVAYHPNHVHFAFVLPLWVALAALLIETSLRALRRAAVTDAVVVGLGLLVVAAMGWQLRENLRVRRAVSSLPVRTHFGRIDVGRDDQVAAFQWIVDFIDREGVRELFTYPCSAGLYLLTGTKNPTPYQIVLRGYTDQDQLEEVVATLESRRLPFVIHSLCIGFEGAQPLAGYIRQHYDRVGPPSTGFQALSVLRRRPDSDR